MQLQRNLPELEKKGIGLAAISYDAPATLKAFADARGITFPLLSDPGSATIKTFNLLNAQATGRMAGIPYPGTFVLDARGIVISRSFEESYQERASATSVLGTVASAAGAPQKAETAHLAVTASATDAVVTPGSRFSLLIDVAPKPRMHVYSPDQSTYIPISIAIEAEDALKVHEPRFPESEIYLFKPLNERQRVYSRPFRIVQDVTVTLTPAMRQRARAEGATLTVRGVLRYQACDDKVCYQPATVPLSWTVGLQPLAR